MQNKNAFQEYWLASIIAFTMLVFFVLLQRAGLVNIVGGGEMGYGAVFLVGVIASLSSCMAVVGGIVLSLSATFAKAGSGIRPQLYFHMGRLGGFFVLGGVIGILGTAFTLSTVMTFLLNVVIAVVMIILGFKLLGVSFFDQVRISFPQAFRIRIERILSLNTSLTPLFVGVATFFMPCGFTQSMQLYTLGTGSFVGGGLTMLIFALGTLPILALVSVSSVSLAESKYAGVFYKTAGIIVLAFALLNLINSFVIIGFINPVFHF